MHGSRCASSNFFQLFTRRTVGRSGQAGLRRVQRRERGCVARVDTLRHPGRWACVQRMSSLGGMTRLYKHSSQPYSGERGHLPPRGAVQDADFVRDPLSRQQVVVGLAHVALNCRHAQPLGSNRCQWGSPRRNCLTWPLFNCRMCGTVPQSLILRSRTWVQG